MLVLLTYVAVNNTNTNMTFVQSCWNMKGSCPNQSHPIGLKIIKNISLCGGFFTETQLMKKQLTLLSLCTKVYTEQCNWASVILQTSAELRGMICCTIKRGIAFDPSTSNALLCIKIKA